MLLAPFADEWLGFLPFGALEQIRADVALTYAQAGAVLAAMYAGGLIGNLFSIAADYVSRRALAALGALGVALAMTAFALAGSFWMLAAAAFLWGAACDAFEAGCEVALVDLAGDGLPKVLARANAWAAVGDLLGPASLIAAAALGFGWRGVLLASAGIMLAYAAWLAALRLPPPRPPEHLANPFAGLAAVLRDPRVLLLALLDGLFGLLDEPLLGFAIAYLERMRGLGAEAAVALAMSAVVGGLAGYLWAGAAARAEPAPRTLTLAAGGLCLALPAMVYAPWVPLQAAGGVAFGFTGAVFYAALQAKILMLRPGQAGSVSAVISLTGAVGLLYPALVGAASDRFGLAAGLGLYAAIPLALLAATSGLARAGTADQLHQKEQ